MPKSKRVKLVSLTKAKKRSTRERKAEIFEEIREAVKTYKNVFVFDINHSRSKYFKEIRTKWRDDSKFFLTKNKLMTAALGRDAETECAKDIHKVSQQIKGLTGLLFTNKDFDTVVKFFNEYKVEDFAKEGFVTNQSVVIEKGIIDWMAHSMEERLIHLGLPAEVKDGKINMRHDFVVCKVGDTLNPTQTKILKLFGYKLAEFSMKLKCHWSNGVYKDL